MGTHRRGTDGRRNLTPEFKPEQIGRVLRKELTVAELSRELHVEQSVVRRWKHLADRGSTTAGAANEERAGTASTYSSASRSTATTASASPP